MTYIIFKIRLLISSFKRTYVSPLENMAKDKQKKAEKKDGEDKVATNGAVQEEDTTIANGRFSEVFWHPKFHRLPRREKRFVVDRRFEGMFSDPSFGLSRRDTRGRPAAADRSRQQSSKGFLEKFYELERKGDDDDSSNGEEQEEKVVSLDLARGEGNLSSSDDDDSELGEDEDAENDGDEDEHWAELDRDAPVAEEPTRRLAICNLDWQRLRAVDMFVLLRSFLPSADSAARLLSLRIYPSDYGVERMADEEKFGPKIVRSKPPPAAPQSSQNAVCSSTEQPQQRLEEDELTKDQIESIRRYELDRMRYYYAVAEFDSSSTASAIYDSCDGIEYENSSIRLDLRFIPDAIHFDDRPVKDEVVTGTGEEVSDKYRPRLFESSALQKVKTKLSWDETDKERRRIAKEAFQCDGDELNLDRNQLRAIIASSSSDDDEEKSSRTANKRSLLCGGDASSRADVFGRADESDGDNVGIPPPTRKADSGVEQSRAESHAKTKKRRPKRTLEGHKKNRMGGFAADIEDPRFKGLFNNPLFNIDKSNPRYKESEVMDKIMKKKCKIAESRMPVGVAESFALAT